MKPTKPSVLEQTKELITLNALSKMFFFPTVYHSRKKDTHTHTYSQGMVVETANEAIFLHSMPFMHHLASERLWFSAQVCKQHPAGVRNQ